MAKKNPKERTAAPAAVDPAATQETKSRRDKTEEESGAQGGADLERSEDPAVDQGGKTPPADPERIAELNSIADKVFAGHPVQTLYFTADRLGFGSRSDAEAHASALDDPTITEITRK